MIKTITVFTIGDSRKMTTWSGIPYFLAHQLELEGIKVHRVNIAPNRYLNWLYKHSIFRMLQKIHPGSEYDYIKSYIHRFLMFFKVLFFQILYREADVDLLLTYSTDIIYRKNRTVMLSDWTLVQYIKNQLKRSLYSEEQNYYNYQLRCMKRVKHIISLFPLSATYLSSELGREVKCLGSNVVNNCYEGNVTTELVEKKYKTQRILFIGRSAYAKGAQLLLESFINLQKTFPKLELHYVGITSSTLKLTEVPMNVFFHGYLRKETEKDRRLYYELMTEATLFVNPTQEWGGYSSTIEAMYFYTPVVVAPYNEFVSEFGDSIKFGKYIDEFSSDKLLRILKGILNSSRKEYLEMSVAAHQNVENHTWQRFIYALLNIL